MQSFSEDGSVVQSFLLQPPDLSRKETSCSDVGADSPCLANGSAVMHLNGEQHTKLGEFTTGDNHFVSAANMPEFCKHATKDWTNGWCGIRKSHEYSHI